MPERPDASDPDATSAEDEVIEHAQNHPNDDPFWKFERGPGDRPRINPLQAGLVALVAIALVIFLVARQDDGDSDNKTTAAPTTAPPATSVVTATTAGGASTRWDPATQSKPALLGPSNTTTEQVPADAPPGAYLWSDFNGWHLWIVADASLAGAVATVTADKGLARANAVGTTGTATIDGDRVTFAASDGTRVAALDFQPGFYARYFTLDIVGSDGNRIAPMLVHSGGSAASPPAMPLVVTKEAA